MIERKGHNPWEDIKARKLLNKGIVKKGCHVKIGKNIMHIIKRFLKKVTCQSNIIKVNNPKIFSKKIEMFFKQGFYKFSSKFIL